MHIGDTKIWWAFVGVEKGQLYCSRLHLWVDYITSSDMVEFLSVVAVTIHVYDNIWCSLRKNIILLILRDKAFVIGILA